MTFLQIKSDKNVFSSLPDPVVDLFGPCSFQYFDAKFEGAVVVEVVDVLAQLEAVYIAHVGFPTRGPNEVEAANNEAESTRDFGRNFSFFRC